MRSFFTNSSQFVGMSFEVHNGKEFLPVTVAESMAGHRFGEFAPTENQPSIKKSSRKNNQRGRILISLCLVPVERS